MGANEPPKDALRERAARIVAEIERERPDLLRLWLDVGARIVRGDCGLAGLGLIALLTRLR